MPSLKSSSDSTSWRNTGLWQVIPGVPTRPDQGIHDIFEGGQSDTQHLGNLRQILLPPELLHPT